MKTVLIVDDSMFMRNMLKSIIKEQYNVIAEASNGKEAIIQYKNHKPDIVMLDITMPDMDGITALKELKKINNNLQAIMCSAMGQQGMVLEAIQSGAKDFIVKPFDSNRVLEALSKFS